jgi:sugar lactone lactonase YvrE
MRRLRPRLALLWLGAALCAAAAGAAHAVSTRQFSLDSAGVLSAGKLEGAAVLSSGAVVPSVGVRRIAIENTAVARSLLVRADGSALIGTGNSGKIWKLTGDVAAPFADTGELLVSSLAQDDGGTLYAGTLPKGKIFAIDKNGKARLFASPEGAEHVWALVYDAKKRTLFAATGPQGKVFAIDKNGKADVYYASKAAHVMSLAAAPGGELYAGTSDEALLLRIDGPGRAEVAYDFEGSEVTAIALENGRIAATANQFPKPASDKKKDDKKDDQQSTDKTETAGKEAVKPGTGELWVVESNGQARKRFASDEGHITAVQWGDGGVIYAATSKGGRVYRVEPDGKNSLWVDVDERQVLALALRSAQPLFVTGDAAAAYRVLPGAASEALWTSKVLDAQFPARWGQLSWRGDGKLTFQTRAGNSEKPEDGGWSEWSSALAQPGPIRSPGGRFLQVRARLDRGTDSKLYAVQAYYLPGNQPAAVKDIAIKPVQPKGREGAEDAPTANYRIEWKTDNPDGDRLRFRLRYRPENRKDYRDILRETEILTKATHDWDTEAIPDGYYRVRIEASDELDNPEPSVLRESAESEPFLLDNHAPRIEGLRHENGKVRGTARDELGPISKLEYALDGHDWKPFNPDDDLFDTSAETFTLALDPPLPAGSHVIAVRAKDARGNAASTELWISVR